MVTLNLEAQISTAQLLNAVEQMPAAEFDTFVMQVLNLRAQRHAPHLSHDESALLLQIHQPLPAELQQRYTDLLAKRRTHMLTTSEQQELLTMTDEIEQRDAQRVTALTTLAMLRGISVDALMHDLHIPTPTYD